MDNLNALLKMKKDLNALVLWEQNLLKKFPGNTSLSTECLLLKKAVASLLSKTFYLEEQLNVEFDPAEYKDWEEILGIHIKIYKGSDGQL